MAKLMSKVNLVSGHQYKTKLTATLEGGPELAAAMKRLDEAVRVKAAKAAVEAMGEPIRAAWQDRIPRGPEPYHLEDAITVKASKTKTGASGSVAVRQIAGPEADEQPFLYVRKVEFGDGDQQPHPAALPGFEASKQEAVDAAERVIREAVMSVVR